MIDFQVAVDKLHGFDTADEIADFFRGQCVKAEIGKSQSCAISKWVSGVTGLTISTGFVDLCVNPEGGMGWDEVKHTQTGHTQAMMDFVRKFDCGEYPDLIETVEVKGYGWNE